MKLNLSRDDLHRKIFFFGLALLVCCLPLSRFVLSISQFLLAFNWLVHGKFREKATLISRKPSILIFASIFVIYLIGLIYTQNMETGMARVKNALPLLLLPLIMGSTDPLSDKQIRQLLVLFSTAVITASIVCLIRYMTGNALVEGDFRKISIFMLHIRFSLLIVMAIFILLYLTLFKWDSHSRSERLLLILSACFLTAFLFFLRSFTGIIIFMAMAAAFMLNLAIRNKRSLIRYALLLLVAFLFMAPVTVAVWTWVNNFRARPVSLPDLETMTVNGTPYFHDIHSGALEHGHYIDLYICEPELRQEWNRISTIAYDSADRRGQHISLTIRRYLTSLDLRKDSAGLSRLKNADINRIENGLTGPEFREHPGMYQRLYETLWEVHIFLKSGYVRHHSLGQRLAFVSTAVTQIGKNRWTGLGTGDVYDAMLKEAKNAIPAVDPRWEGKPHNQFIFYTLAFGLLGFLVIAYCFAYPVIALKAYRYLLFNIFAGILLLSMLVLDTLESYDSIVFFAFFYCLFVFATGDDEIRKA